MAPELEILDTECFLIRHCLTVEEQIALFEYIEACDMTPPEGTTTRRAMVPAPTTLVLGKNDRGEPQRVLHYAQGDDSMVTGIVKKASEILKEQNLHVFGENNSSRNVFDHHALTMAVIRYEAPDGKFPPHVDHCNDSLVFLTSLGLTANFLVRAHDDGRHDNDALQIRQWRPARVQRVHRSGAIARGRGHRCGGLGGWGVAGEEISCVAEAPIRSAVPDDVLIIG